VISGFCFALVHTANYIVQQQQIKKWHANSLSLKKVNSLFGSGQFDDAFHLIETLNTQDPYEFRFIFARDSLVDVLKEMADHRFREKDFAGAVSYYFKLQHYEQPTRSETIQRISVCQFYLGNYQESLQALKHLHHQQPRNLQLVYEIGILNLDYLDNPEEGLAYFTLGKKLFKENLTQIYGEAFELIVNPSDVPDIYLDIFEGRARSNLLLKNYEDAVTDCNWAVFLRPGYGMGYYLRAKANAELNQTERICRDLEKAKARGVNTIEMENKFCSAPTTRP
jgi:tetratricopeptide (TPR) repeat protein